MKPIESRIIERVKAALNGKPGVSVNSGDLEELLRVATEHAAMLEMPEIAAIVSRVKVSTSTVIVSGNARVGGVFNVGNVGHLTIE